jgi:hypothetical protein
MGDTVSGSTQTDLSPHGRDGTITGATVVAGHIGNALSFDGINDFLDTGFTGSTLTKGAVSLWVPRDIDVSHNLVARASSADNSNFVTLQIELTTGEMRIVVDNATVTSVVSGNVAISVGAAFHHLVFQSTGTAWEMFLDSVKQTLTVDVGSNTGDWFGDVGNLNINLARLARIIPGFSDSIIDQVRITSEPYTQAEVDALFNEGAP